MRSPAAGAGRTVASTARPAADRQGSSPPPRERILAAARELGIHAVGVDAIGSWRSDQAPLARPFCLTSGSTERPTHFARGQVADAEQAALALGVSVKTYRVITFGELEPALAAMVADRMNGLVNFQGGLSLVNRELIVDFAAKHGLPAIYQATLFALAGGLIAWAPDLDEQFRTAARYVDEILKGANPGGLPIRHPSRYYLTVNAGAAKNIGLALPPALLAQADRVLP